MEFAAGDFVEPKLPPLYNSLIFTADPQLQTESRKMAILRELPHVHVFKTYVGRDFAPLLLQKFLQTPDHIPSLLSAFINEKTPDFIFLEVTNITILTKLFPTTVFETVQSPSFISNFCNIGRFNPTLFYGKYFARHTVLPYVNDTVEILDANYSQKKAIIRHVPVFLVQNPDNTKSSVQRLFNPEQVSSKIPPQPVKVRVNYKGDNTSFADGYRFRDETFVNGFLIEEVPLHQLITWSSPTTPEEMFTFISPEEMDSFEQYQKGLQNDTEEELKNEQKVKKNFDEAFAFKIPRFDTDETPSSLRKKLKFFKSQGHSRSSESHESTENSQQLSTPSQDISQQQIMQIQQPSVALFNKVQEQYANICETFPSQLISLPSEKEVVILDLPGLRKLLKDLTDQCRSMKLKYEHFYALLQQIPEQNETVMSKTKRTFKELGEQIQKHADQTAKQVHQLLVAISDVKSIIQEKSQGKSVVEITQAVNSMKKKQNQLELKDKIKNSNFKQPPASHQEKQLHKEPEKPISTTVLTNLPQGPLDMGDIVVIKQKVQNVHGTVCDVKTPDSSEVSETTVTIRTNPFLLLVQRDDIDPYNSYTISSICPMIFDLYDVVYHEQYGICVVFNCSFRNKKIGLITQENHHVQVPYETVKPGQSDSSVRTQKNEKILPGDNVCLVKNPNKKGTVLGTKEGKAFVLFPNDQIICLSGVDLDIIR